MKTTFKIKKLALSRETLVSLSNEDVRKVGGGATSMFTNCDSWNDWCQPSGYEFRTACAFCAPHTWTCV